MLCLIPPVQSQFAAIIIPVCSFWCGSQYLSRYSELLGVQRSWDPVLMGSGIFDTRRVNGLLYVLLVLIVVVICNFGL